MGHDTAGCAQGRAAVRARMAWLAEGRDTKNCIVAERGWPWIAIQRARNCNTAATRCDMAQKRHDMAEGALHGALCARGRGQAYDTVSRKPRHVEHRPTTRPRHGRPGRSASGLCAQAGQGVHLVHPPSFGLSALFGPLFMNIVHEHYSQHFSK